MRKAVCCELLQLRQTYPSNPPQPKNASEFSLTMPEDYGWVGFHKKLPTYRGICDTPKCTAAQYWVRIFSPEDDFHCQGCGRVFNDVDWGQSPASTEQGPRDYVGQ
eukprot:gb/GEZN01027791.1/.p1 GENE.gb/GEZN01027791.1/~~gb/GEZN01027791.1/.p1  ORF type:complete len:106 (+),score=9.22 gb/GEZN01027791.1/:82-399(+)